MSAWPSLKADLTERFGAKAKPQADATTRVIDGMIATLRAFKSGNEVQGAISVGVHQREIMQMLVLTAEFVGMLLSQTAPGSRNREPLLNALSERIHQLEAWRAAHLKEIESGQILTSSWRSQ